MKLVDQETGEDLTRATPRATAATADFTSISAIEAATRIPPPCTPSRAPSCAR